MGSFFEFLARMMKGRTVLGIAFYLCGQRLLILFSKQKNLTTPTFAGAKSFSWYKSLAPGQCNPT